MIEPVGKTRRLGSRGLRWAVRAAGLLGGATLAVGALHMPFARPLLMRFGGCPMVGRMTPELTDTARRLAVTPNRGKDEAPARPVFSFALDKTTASDVHTWAARGNINCDDVRPGLIRCTHLPAVALGLPETEGGVDELALGFGARGRLVNVTTLRSHMKPDAAAHAAREIASSLADRLGPPTTSAGDFDAVHLSRPSAYSIGAVSYRYSDYFADVVAMNLASSGPSIREHYMSARD